VKRPILVLGLVATLVLAAASALAAQVFVKGRTATIRDGKTSRSAVVGTADKGAALEVLEEGGGFYRVKLPSGAEGWVSSVWVDVKPPAKDGEMEKLGAMARSGGSSDVSYTAGARGLSPQAREFAATRDAAAVAAALERMEAVRIAPETIERFLEEGGLGPYREAAR
jgi:hypothetical protein